MLFYSLRQETAACLAQDGAVLEGGRGNVFALTMLIAGMITARRKQADAA